MFIRVKKSGKHKYLQIVNSTRVYNTVEQKVIANLGRVENYERTGRLLELADSCMKVHEVIKKPDKKH